MVLPLVLLLVAFFSSATSSYWLARYFAYWGVLPLATVPFLYFLLPESIRFLVLKKKSTEKIERIIHRIAPHLNSTPTLVPTVNEVEKSSLKDLFNKGFALGTF